ncbi:hypothetical protein BJ878DRAFT_532639 [Calycina marina]|uniref:Uncharacterized protein n=1 Tax=Calycina marina TaxID=1763456 RepID=A0A9P7Z9C0_9HELO|nr:hypothetical protein BJ878DRAFT_532639 [Calycina marina]
MLDQCRGKKGRRVCGIKSSSTLGTYWKIFRLIYDEANDANTTASSTARCTGYRKEHKLSNKKRGKTAVYLEDLVGILQTNLTTTKKYGHGRHRIQLALFHHLAGFSANRPQAVLDLCYRHIVVTLLRDPLGGPRRILLEFSYEFIKQF